MSTQTTTSARCPPHDRFVGKTPHFIIAGAMKCGTSSLHAILSRFPRIYIPENEVSFFDSDDLTQHPDYACYYNKEWRFINFDEQVATGAPWYCRHFSAAPDNALIGEDSTGYLASSKVPERLARYLPHVKLIVMLRNPADRTYSHYWHSLRTGREMYRFEQALQYTPSTLYQRSCYKDQILRFLANFSRDRLHFVVFEDFVQDMASTINGVCQFLGVPVPSDATLLHAHANPSRLPRSVWMRLWENSALRTAAGTLYLDRLFGGDSGPMFRPHYNSFWCVWAKRACRLVNPHLVKSPPPMRRETRDYLDSIFRRENEGLDEIIGKRLDTIWYSAARK